jgi:prepilin peptidase CpaA
MSLPLSPYWSSAMILASAVILLLAAWHDIVSRTVPNWMSIAIACFGVAAAFADGRLAMSLGIGVGMFALAAFCWRRGWMGGADVKLIGAVAIVLPPGMVPNFVMAMSLAGALHAIAYLLARRVVTAPPPLASQTTLPSVAGSRRRSLGFRALRVERWRISRGGPLPYACAIAFGYLFVICNGAAS